MELWHSIGDNQSLKLLDLSYSGKLKNPEKIGSGVAFNAKRKGSLEYLLLEDAMDISLFKKFFAALSIS